MKHYHTVLSLSRKIESLGISHDTCLMLMLITPCEFWLLNFEKNLKHGLEPNIVTFATFIVGSLKSKINRAVDLFNEMVARGYQSDILLTM